MRISAKRNIKRNYSIPHRNMMGQMPYHHHLTGHEIDFKNTTILAEEKAHWPRLIKEGIEIKRLKPEERANMQAGYEISPIWDFHLGFEEA